MVAPPNDVDYRGYVFPDPTNPCVNVLLSLKVNCNSASSQLKVRPEPPTQASECLSSFGAADSLPLSTLYRVHVCPQLVPHELKQQSFLQNIVQLFEKRQLQE